MAPLLMDLMIRVAVYSHIDMVHQVPAMWITLLYQQKQLNKLEDTMDKYDLHVAINIVYILNWMAMKILHQKTKVGSMCKWISRNIVLV